MEAERRPLIMFGDSWQMFKLDFLENKTAAFYPRWEFARVRFLLTIIGEACAARKCTEIQDHEAAIRRNAAWQFFPLAFFLLFFLRGTCCRVARQTRGMPGLIKDGTRSPTPDKSFPKAVTLRTKRENENARLESTLFSRSSEQHERDGSELDAKFESRC